MMMTRDAPYEPDNLSAEIRRQIGSEPMRRFVRSLPAFAVKHTLPAHLRELLDRLDRAENLDRNRSDRRS